MIFDTYLNFALTFGLYLYNKSNTDCGIIRPTNAFTWDHIHNLEGSYRECQNIKVHLLT